MTRLLLVTCGDTDLRTVVKDGAGEALALLAAPTRRALHQKLLDNEIEHVIDDTAAGMAQTEKGRLPDRTRTRARREGYCQVVGRPHERAHFKLRRATSARVSSCQGR